MAPSGNSRLSSSPTCVRWATCSRPTRQLTRSTFSQLVSLSLANNGLTSILPLSPYLLTSSFPNLRNISFASNQLTRRKDFDGLSPCVGSARNDKKFKGFRNLVELVLTGNPLVGTGAQEATYRVYGDARAVENTKH